jgi:hypothetical protein
MEPTDARIFLSIAGMNAVYGVYADKLADNKPKT